jgi:hypothetical protein
VKRFGLALVGAVVLTGLVAPSAGAAPHEHWESPQCGKVAGDGSLSFTRDDGRSIAPTSSAPQPVQYEFAVAPLSTANTVLSVDNHGTVQASPDAGCSWIALGSVKGLAVPRMAAGPDGEAYVWDEKGPNLYRIDGIRVRPLPPVGDANTDVAALAVDRYFPRHLRAVLGDGTVRDSYDAGQTFRTTAKPVRPGLFLYDAAIDPVNVNHIVLGTLSDGVYTTWLGGLHWTQSTLGKRINAFSVAVSPANPLVVWAQGINLDEYAAHAPSEGRHIYRSTDGGFTFRVAVDQQPGVTLVNGALLAPSPADANTVYFVYGTSYASYGTDLFRYDARRNSLSAQHNDHDGIKSIAFNPKDPQVMYLGFAAES